MDITKDTEMDVKELKEMLAALASELKCTNEKLAKYERRISELEAFLRI